MTDKFPKNGFTVIEMLVGMGVFLIVLGIVLGVFVSSLRTERAMIDILVANDNASLSLEQMVREMRTGGTFSIPGGGSAGTSLQFQNANGQTVIYSLNAANKILERSLGGVVSEITSKNILIKNLNFVIVPDYFAPPFGQFAGSWPPRITVTIDVGSSKPELAGVSTRIQTTVSARNI